MDLRPAWIEPAVYQPLRRSKAAIARQIHLKCESEAVDLYSRSIGDCPLCSAHSIRGYGKTTENPLTMRQSGSDWVPL